MYSNRITLIHSLLPHSIQLKAIFALHHPTLPNIELQPDIEILDRKIIRISQELGTADFIVHHIHAFTIHMTFLILSKGILYARNSRLVSDKLELGLHVKCNQIYLSTYLSLQPR
jgi:hypothetical protein